MLSSFLFSDERNPKMVTTKPSSPSIQIEPLSLKTLADSGLASQSASNCISRSVRLSSSSPPASYSSSEQEVEEEEEEEEEEENACWGSYGRSVTHKFPPPIPLLARTANLSCHMPWVLERTYKDGSLVIREVPVKHHEYFRTRRENGRLMLQLVRLDGYLSKINRAALPADGEEEEEEEEEEETKPFKQKYMLSSSSSSSMPERTQSPLCDMRMNRMRAVRI